MKTALAAIIFFGAFSISLEAQSTPAQQPPAQQAPAQTQTRQPVVPDLNATLADLQKIVMTTSSDIGKMRIDKWKADSSQKQQMQQVADSLQRNITHAVPSLITDVQSSHGSVSKTFQLYDNINVVYEFLNSLAEAAGAFGRKEEYEPLAADASALDNIRRSLSSYVEQAAVSLETRPQPNAAANSQTTQTPKKIVIDDNAPPKKTTKKKKASSPPPPSQ